MNINARSLAFGYFAFFSICFCSMGWSQEVPSSRNMRQFTILENLYYLLGNPSFFGPHTDTYGPPQLIHITVGNIEPLSLVDGPAGGPDLQISPPRTKGIIEFIDPNNVTKTIRTISYDCSVMGLAGSGGTYPRSWPGILLVGSEPAYALALLNPKQVADGLISRLPAATAMIPDDWTTDFGRILAAPDPAPFFVPKKSIDLATVSKWDLLVYGTHLADTDFPEFQRQFSNLLEHSDMYLAAILTDRLINGGLKNRMDVTRELEGYLSNATKPQLIAAIVMAVGNKAGTFENAELYKLIGMARKRANNSSPAWEDVRGLLAVVQSSRLQSIPEQSATDGTTATTTTVQKNIPPLKPAITSSKSAANNDSSSSFLTFATTWQFPAIIAFLAFGIWWFVRKR